jgi:hypothetical protein
MDKEQKNYFRKMLQREADERGVTLEVLFDQLETMLKLINKPLPPEGRLTYTEALIREGVIGKDQADLILRNNPLLEPEIRELIDTAKEAMGREFGLELDDYDLVFDEQLNIFPGLIIDFVDPINRTVTLPSEGSIYTPLVAGHVLAHIFQNENSRIGHQLRVAYEEDGVEAYKLKHNEARLVIEGWAVFLTRQYAFIRDAAIGQPFYAPIEEELWAGVDRYIQTKGITNEYENGYDLYRQIYERDGIVGAIWAAKFMSSDEELRAYAVEEESPFSKA